MQVDSIFNGVATIEGYEVSKSVFLLWECGRYKANDNSWALANALYNTFRTCVKVIYNTCGVVFPKTRSFPFAYGLYIERAGNHTGGCLECDIVSCV